MVEHEIAQVWHEWERLEGQRSQDGLSSGEVR